MADLDEISMVLGEIRSDIRHVVRWSEEHERADECRFVALAERLDAITVNLPRLEKVENDVEEIKPVIEHVKRAKWIAAGAFGVLSVIGGFISSFATQLWKMGG